MPPLWRWQRDGRVSAHVLADLRCWMSVKWCLKLSESCVVRGTWGFTVAVLCDVPLYCFQFILLCHCYSLHVWVCLAIS